MPRFIVPTNATIHAAHNFLESNRFFDGMDEGILVLDPRWVHMEPVALAMAAAWGGWCRRRGIPVRVENLGRTADYAARMRLFEHLKVDYDPKRAQYEEAGRFVPLTNIRTPKDIGGLIADLSALLHLDKDPESLAAIQYCSSELLRNVLEHSSSPEGAYACAHNFAGEGPHRVTLAVADCGMGITRHLSRVYPQVAGDHRQAIRLAMQPGITGATGGPYGPPENAGAGLFVTRSIAKGTGGYFLLTSGTAAYRLRRSSEPLGEFPPSIDPFADTSDRWLLPSTWEGTVVSLEIRTEKILQFQDFFSWIREHAPPRIGARRPVRFT